MEVAAGFFLALVSFGANLVQLLIVPAVAFEAANVVEAPLVVEARCQRLDTQVKGDDAILAYRVVLPFLLLFALLISIALGMLLRIIVDTRAIVVATCIPGHRYLMKVLRRVLGEMGHDVGIAFAAPIAATPCWEGDSVALYFQLHGGIAKGKELVAWFDARKAWCLATFY